MEPTIKFHPYYCTQYYSDHDKLQWNPTVSTYNRSNTARKSTAEINEDPRTTPSSRKSSPTPTTQRPLSKREDEDEEKEERDEEEKDEEEKDEDENKVNKTRKKKKTTKT